MLTFQIQSVLVLFPMSNLQKERHIKFLLDSFHFSMKSREQLTAQGHSFQWFSYAYLKERFNIGKK